MIKLLFLLSVVSLTEAFVVPRPSLKQFTTSLASAHNAEALARLQHEYRVLQERLYLDIVVKHDEKDTVLVEEKMIEIATQATQIQEKEQIEIMEAADRSKAQAERYAKLGQDLNIQAHKARAKLDEHLVEEMEAAYEDLVRQSSFKELEAIQKKEAAEILLAELKENERRLQATLASFKKEKENKALEEELHSQHRSFLTTVKDAIYAHPDILIGLDPHIL